MRMLQQGARLRFHVRTVISILVAVSVALHSVLGCCWHHAHETESATVEVARKPAETVRRCCCHRHHSEAETTAAETESQEHNSGERDSAPCGEKCQYVAAARVQLDDLNSNWLIAWLPLIDGPIVEPVHNPSRVHIDTTAADPPPVRLHLLHQLLLI